MSAERADQFCGCVADQLAPLSVREKMSIPEDKSKAAIAYCVAHG